MWKRGRLERKKKRERRVNESKKRWQKNKEVEIPHRKKKKACKQHGEGVERCGKG